MEEPTCEEEERLILDALDYAVMIYDTSLPWRVIYLNDAAERLFGHPLDGLRDKPLGELFRPFGQGITTVRWINQLGEKSEDERQIFIQTPWRKKAFLVEFQRPRLLPNRRHMLLVIREAATEQRLRDNLRLVEEAFEFSPEAIMITDEAGTILRINPAFTLITGYTPTEVIGRNARILRSGKHDASFYKAFWQALVDQGHWHGEIWDKRKNGEIYPKWLCINAVVEPDGARKYVALFADISERKRHEERIEHMARHDPLTGLLNRFGFEEYGRDLFRHARRKESRAALFMIDLDRFKEVNDTFGHQAGDQVLIESAARLTSCLRSSDIVVRWGGDEFVVLVTGIGDEDEAVTLAEKIHSRLAEPIRLNEGIGQVTPSIGIALYPDNTQDLEGLVKAADAAMYQVKEAGRSGWRFYCRDDDDSLRRRHWLERELRAALTSPEEAFALVFQPQIDLSAQKVISWEALLRWRHPQAGEIRPDEFIPIAEASGLILPLGWWVIEQALAEFRQWMQYRPGERLALNIARAQLLEADFATRFLASLEAHAIPAHAIEIELKENALADDHPTIRQHLVTLRSAGVSLTIDDFGAGSRSLANLMYFLGDRLKIDRQFLAEMHNKNAAALVASILALSAAMGLEVIAEGVESAEQLAFLRERQCFRMQGFLTGQPMAAESVRDYQLPLEIVD